MLVAILTHRFAVGHDFSNHAVDQALTKGTANEIADYLDLILALTLAAGMIAAMVGAMRVGLVVRWVGVLGIVTAILIFLPIGSGELEIVPAFWMVAMGMLYAGRWPNGDPPAWAAGEARPWPSQAQARAAKQAGRGTVLAGVGADVGPAAAQPVASGSSRKRRRKRGARG